MDDERLIELLRALPPAPETWVQAAQALAADPLGTVALVTEDEGWETATDDDTAWSLDEWRADDDDPDTEPLGETES